MSNNLSINAQFDAINKMIMRDGLKAYKATIKGIDEAADDVLAEAKNNAPADKYNLENAIVRTDSEGSKKSRDSATGRFLPYKAEVYVKDEVTDETTGKTVSVKDYALIMEESNRYNPSRPGNVAKRAAGGDPGRKYMERAYVKVMSKIYQKIRAKVGSAI